MASFEELQQSWKQQPDALQHTLPALQERIIKQWTAQQRIVRRSNILSTIGFIVVFIVFIRVYLAYHAGRTIFFGGSILFMTLLMLVYLGVLWKGQSFKKTDLSAPGKDYIARSIEALKWRRKTITVYARIYSVLLFAGLMCYYQDVLAGGNLWWRLGVPALTALYVFGVLFITERTKTKKRVVNIDALIRDLEAYGEDL